MDEKIRIYNKVKKFLDDKGVTFYKLSQETGIATSTFSEWGKGNYIPKATKLILVANYMGITLDELLK